MARPRKLRKDLPECVYFKNGAYYFVKNNKWSKLDRDYNEAMVRWAKLIDAPKSSSIKTVGALLDRYFLEVVPGKSERTQKDNRIEARWLRAFFGDMGIESVSAPHIAEYLSTRTAKTRANREVALLSHAFSKAIVWGLTKTNPCAARGIRNKEVARDRYVTDEEVKEFETLCPPWLVAYIEIKLLTGMRQQDLLALEWSDIDSEGISVCPIKTQRTTRKKIKIELTEELSQLLNALPNTSKTVFATRSESMYTSSGFGSIWRRLMTKFVSSGNTRFHEHDLRGKVATDLNDKNAAQSLLGHATATTTERYIKQRQTNLVKPARRKK